MRMRTVAAVAAAIIGLLPRSGAAGDECRYQEARTASAAISPGAVVEVHAGAGFLHVAGVSGLTEVRGDGTACADSSGRLDAIRLVVSPMAHGVRVEAVTDARGLWSSGSGRLDLTLEVPADAVVEIHDGSGELRVEHVAEADIQDGSGELTLRDVAGRASIHDGSGGIEVAGVHGPLEIEDGSGDIVVRDVASVRLSDGSGDVRVSEVTGDVVVVDDGSGDLHLADVTGSVTVRRDGSGDIDVADVGGDLEVGEAGSGGVRHERIAGRVDIARR